MTVSINDSVCERNGLRLEELLAVLLIKTGASIPDVISSLEDREVIVKDVLGGYRMTRRWDDVVSSILLDSDRAVQTDDRLESLAQSLMDIFPKQKKEGTSHYFRGNKKDNILRLKKFFKLYGDRYTDSQILDAAKAYVESFNGDYRYMRVLKYFIWKDAVKTGPDGTGYVDESSDLASIIENEGAAESLRNDWTTNIV